MPNFSNLKCFFLVIGNARSGSTLLGSVIDAHPNAIVANETLSSANYWRGVNRQEILDEILLNSKRNQSTGRMSEGYSFSIKQKDNAESQTIVMGDKIWNPATLMLHGEHSLLGEIEKKMGVPVRILHSIRNPFDAIATMHMRSKASIPNRMLWYFMHCDAANAVQEHMHNSRFMDVHHETFVSSPDKTISDLCQFLGVEFTQDYCESCKDLLFKKPKQTRFDIAWDRKDIQNIVTKISQYPFLEQYANEDYSSLPLSQ